MTERLVARRGHIMHGDVVPLLHRRRWVGGVVGAVRGGGVRAQRLVGVRGFFGGDAAVLAVAVVVGGAAGAAARADEPEQAGGEGEGDGEPGRGEHVLAHAAGDAVRFESGVKSAVEGDEERGRSDRGGDGEEERYLGIVSII